ncbi:Methionine aminopeptidase 2, partial [Linderina pennispora]
MSVAEPIDADTAAVDQKMAELSVSSPADHASTDAKPEDEHEDADGEKKKKKKKKKSGNKHKKKGPGAAGQTTPPTIPVSKLFLNKYPEGHIHEYIDDNSYRTTSEEMRAKERLCEQQVNDLRRAAEVHREVRSYARSQIKPGMDLADIAEMIENGTRTLVEEKGFEAGIGFPTGLSINHCAAHYTPNTGDH